MSQYKDVRTRQLVPGNYYGQGDYPGVGEFIPYAPPGQNPYLPALAPSNTGTGLLGNLNFKEIKTFVDRMGGIDGIMNTVTKMQKIMQSIQQMTPMLKLLIPKLGAQSASKHSNDDDGYSRRRRRRRTKARRSASPKRYRNNNRPANFGKRRR